MPDPVTSTSGRLCPASKLDIPASGLQVRGFSAEGMTSLVGSHTGPFTAAEPATRVSNNG